MPPPAAQPPASAPPASAHASQADLVRAVDLAITGDRTAAHAIVDPLEHDQTACWINACLHKLEGDEPTARAWYRRSRQFYESFPDARAELVAIKAALTY